MQLTIVMAQKGDMIGAELCGDLDMIEGDGLEHRLFDRLGTRRSTGIQGSG